MHTTGMSPTTNKPRQERYLRLQAQAGQIYDRSNGKDVTGLGVGA